VETTDDLQQAAESLLMPSQPEEVEANAEPQVNATDEEEIEAGEEAAEGEADEAPEEDDEADEVEASDDDDGSEEEEDDGGKQSDTFTVKVNGEEVQVTLDDLTRSYSGQEYIRRGMEEAAAKRKEAEQVYTQLQQQQQQFVQTVQRLQETGLKAAPTPPDASLLDSDPIGYMQEQARYDTQMREYQAQQQQIQQVQAQQMQAAQRANQMYLEEQKAQLATMVPEFGDAEKAPEFKAKLARAAVESYGMTEAELSQIMDARHVKILADAMRWQELQAGKVAAQKPKPKPKNVKPTGRRKPSKVVARQKAKEQARKSGRLEDFASLILK
jgi:hypothetical protein